MGRTTHESEAIMRHRFCGLVLGVLALGCRGSAPRTPTSSDVAAVAEEVQARVREYGAALTPARCQDPDSFDAFWTDERGGVVLAENGRILQLDAEANRARDLVFVCGVREQSVTVDTVVVQVLNAETAIATWSFREVFVDSMGTRLHIRGDVMQPWIRLRGTWRSTGLVATHEILPPGGM